ncbi:MAG: hypothetical protein ACE5I1_21800 [bacterium]
MKELEYISDKNGVAKAVVIPIEIWKRILPQGVHSEDEITDAVEDYCLNKAMNEAKKTPLLSKEEAISFLKK